jgi:hypothetical protein
MKEIQVLYKIIIPNSHCTRKIQICRTVQFPEKNAVSLLKSRIIVGKLGPEQGIKS